MAASVSAMRLYRSLLRESNKFADYNYRMYALRKVKETFREHKLEKDPRKIKELLDGGEKNLGVIKRQVIIWDMYKTNLSTVERPTVSVDRK